jgi:hypothetical protein
MNAAQIAAALGGKREGRDWRCQCPVHGGRSLTLADGRDGTLLLHCFGGCESREVFDELRASGLLGDHPGAFRREADETRQRDQLAAKAEIERIRRAITRARDLYRRSVPTVGTPVESYLRSRGINGPIPPVLRFLEYCPHRNGRYYPAMVAPIVDLGGEQIAMHKTFLRPDGSGKADMPKKWQRETRGPMKGGAVRLAQYRPGFGLIIGEGIESTLAAMRMFALPGWAALCADGIEALELPAPIDRVVIAADNDANGVGQRAALSARERWGAETRQVSIVIPPNAGDDFNDLILRRGIQ